MTVVDERTACLMKLQRSFGLRFKESSLLNPKIALKHAREFGVIKLSRGTKGGRKREVPITANGIKALEEAIAIRDGRTMIPKGTDYQHFQDHCYRQAELAGINFHGERHAYAHGRYKDITQAPCPKEAGWQRKERMVKLAEYLGIDSEAAIELDHKARLQVSNELGHNRVEVTNAYLG